MAAIPDENGDLFFNTQFSRQWKQSNNTCIRIPDGNRRKRSCYSKSCTARFDLNTKNIFISTFGKEIISKRITGSHEKDCRICCDDDNRSVDFNIRLNGQTNRYELTIYPVVDNTSRQNIPLAFNLAGEIKNLLRLLGTKEPDLGNVEQPSRPYGRITTAILTKRRCWPQTLTTRITSI